MIEPRFYTGIGSRAAPQSALTRAEGLAYSLAAKGFRGRSGKAPGMDQAFMVGAARFCQQNDLEGMFTNYIPNSNFQSCLEADLKQAIEACCAYVRDKAVRNFERAKKEYEGFVVLRAQYEEAGLGLSRFGELECRI